MHTVNDFAAAGLILLLYGAPIVFAFIFARRERREPLQPAPQDCPHEFELFSGGVVRCLICYRPPNPLHPKRSSE